MQFSNSIWLWALTGVLLPLGIHLLSRKDGQIIKFGSIRFLQASPAAKFRRLKLNEVALLLLRCFLLILAVFIIAGFQSDAIKKHEKWVVLEDGIQDSPKIQSFLEKLRDQDFDIRLMARGFPSVETSGPHKLIQDYWTAVSELATAPADSIVVISYNYQRKFLGPRVPLPGHISWIGHDVEEKEFQVQKVLMDNDSLWLRKGYTSSTITHFETELINAGNPTDTLPRSRRQQLRIRIIKEADYDYDHRVLLASLEAIQTITPHVLEVVTTHPGELNDSSSGFTFWLADEIPVDLPERSMNIAIRACDGKNIPLIMPPAEAGMHCKKTGKETWVITKRLNEDIALKENLAIQLARIILTPITTQTEDRRTLPERMMWSSSTLNEPGAVNRKNENETNPVLMILLVLAFAGERLLAYKRNQ